jgi:ribosomal protein S6--L-glutamate ligase
MKMRVCILTYNRHVHAVTSIVEELNRRGHEHLVVSPLDCSVTISCGNLSVASQGTVIANVNVVLTRCVAYFHEGRPINQNLEAAVASALIQQGAVAVNRPDSKLLAGDKVLSLARLASRHIRVPPTVYACSPTELHGAVHDISRRQVIKLTEGLWGTGVMRVDSEPSFRTVSEAFLSQGHSLLVQPYLLNPLSRQLRILVIGDSVLGAYESKPQAGDFRANLHAGAALTLATVPVDIANTAIACTRALELDFAGVDLIENDDGAYVLEVNPVPGFGFSKEIPEIRIAEALVDYLDLTDNRGPASSHVTISGKPVAADHPGPVS